MAREITRNVPTYKDAKKSTQGFSVIGVIRFLGIRGFVFLFLLGGAATLAYMAYTAPVLRVDGVTVAGAKTVKPSEVELAANITGQNVFLVDSQQVAHAVGSIEKVKSVSVTKRWPNEVIVEIAEREPFALWETKNGKYVIDDGGSVIAQATPGDALPTVFDTESRTMKLGGKIDIESVRLAQILDQRFQREVGVKPVRYEHSSKSGITVATEKGWRAVIGTAENLDYKLGSLKAVLSEIEGTKTKPELIDLRFGMRPYIRVATGTGR